MPILTFSCPKCEYPMGFDYADYDLKNAINSEKSIYHYEELECEQCGKKLKTVPWIAVYDEEEEEPITFV
ncbi:hypothetical protein [Halalkalibacterium ligniniphilum]|uniref:hypothetical protein n=1 Tax=Halalkalibacterium ligniniphilum TaxID=1134413 RepID=UPI000348285E|nr:hypothetical protein [Halalkalibacterium ligniniphilum]